MYVSISHSELLWLRLWPHSFSAPKGFSTFLVSFFWLEKAFYFMSVGLNKVTLGCFSQLMMSIRLAIKLNCDYCNNSQSLWQTLFQWEEMEISLEKLKFLLEANWSNFVILPHQLGIFISTNPSLEERQYIRWRENTVLSRLCLILKKFDNK